MINAKETGRFIAECRRKKGMTQQELGDRLHVTNRAVSKWENGKSFPDVGLLEDLGRELDVSVGDLLAGKRIEAEHYQKETEKMLVEALGNRRLYGYEIVTYIMAVLAVFAFWIPLLTTENGEFLKPLWPPVNVVNVLCWIISAGLIGSILYLDRALPGKGLRGTNAKLSGVMGAVVVLLNFLFPFLRDEVQDSGGRPPEIWDWVLIAAVLLIMLPLGAVVWSCGADNRRQRYLANECEKARDWEQRKELDRQDSERERRKDPDRQDSERERRKDPDRRDSERERGKYPACERRKKEEESTNEDINFKWKSEREEQHHTADGVVSGKTPPGTRL